MYVWKVAILVKTPCKGKPIEAVYFPQHNNYDCDCIRGMYKHYTESTTLCIPVYVTLITDDK